METERIRTLDDYARRSSASRRLVPDLSRAAVVRRFVVIGGLSVGAYYGLLWVGLSLEAAALLMAVGLVFVALLVRSSVEGRAMLTSTARLGATSKSDSGNNKTRAMKGNSPPSDDDALLYAMNPATGSSMIGGIGGVDSSGNVFGGNDSDG